MEVACIVELFAVVISKPWGVGASLKRGVVLSQRFIVQPVSTAMNLGGTTEVLLGRAEKAQKKCEMSDKETVTKTGELAGGPGGCSLRP